MVKYSSERTNSRRDRRFFCLNCYKSISSHGELILSTIHWTSYMASDLSSQTEEARCLWRKMGLDGRQSPTTFYLWTYLLISLSFPCFNRKMGIIRWTSWCWQDQMQERDWPTVGIKWTVAIVVAVIFIVVAMHIWHGSWCLDNLEAIILIMYIIRQYHVTSA